MIYQKHLLQPPLADYVDCLSYIEGNNKGTGLPKTAMSLVFNLADSFRLFTDKEFISHIDYKRHWIAGLQTGPAHVESYGTSKMLVIQFKGLGAFGFLKDPLHYYTDQYVPLEDVFGREADETWEQLKEASSVNEQFKIVERFLYRAFLSDAFPNQKLVSAVNSISATGSALEISQVCNNLGISRKHLSALSKEYLGVTPKMFSSLNRLQRSLKRISCALPERLTEVAYELDYFDQAHFTKNFKKFTGLLPTEYAKLVTTKHSLKVIPHFVPFE